MVREFKLLNENGQEYSFMDIQNYCLLTEPDGLGYSFNSSYEQLNETFISYLRKQEQNQIAGTCNFLNYDNYTKLINFIESSKKLKFCYKIPYKNKTPVEYFRDVKLKGLGKTEIKEADVLSCNIFFDALSLWYEEKEYVYTIGPEENENRWNIRWASRFINYNQRKLDFNNQGHTEAPFYLEIEGPVVNPEIIIEDSDSNILFSLLVPVALVQYEKFLYSSIDGEIMISKQNIDGTIESLMTQSYIDITNNNIYKLPQGVSKITINAEHDITKATLKIYPYFRGV